MVGGVFALYAANLVTLPTGIHFIFCILVAIVAAGIWGAIAGVLKAIFNVSEVISTIMLNYIGMHLSVMMVLNPLVYNKAITAINIDHPTANTPFFLLDKIFKGSYIDISIIMAIVICVLIAFILNKTTFGYQLKAVGNSSEGSKYAGIAYKRNVITTMFISGALAGLGGALTFLPANPAFFSSHEIVMSQGFDGMSVALIANSNPIGIIFSGLFISYLKSGTLSMQLAGYNREIGNIVISAIIYMSALSAFIGGVVKKRFRNRRTKRELEAKGVTINE
jgi:simple sugar transport system permease protein